MKQTTLALVMLSASTTLATGAGFEVLVPHRAVYDVKLERAEERSGIKGMSGRIVFEVKGNECEGVAVRYRFVTRINTARESFVTDQQTATHESSDGKEFFFQTKSFVNEVADQTISGNAVLENDNITVSLGGENKREVQVGNGVFTSTHLISVIEEAEKGSTFVSHDVFDGSGEADKLLNSASVIGKPKVVLDTLEGETEESIKDLRDQSAWPVTMSYFKKDVDNSAEALPIYEASFLLYKNGITRQLEMRYPDYALKASLKEIEYYEDAPCELEN